MNGEIKIIYTVYWYQVSISTFSWHIAGGKTVTALRVSLFSEEIKRKGRK